ncbi:DNA-3-methyladenine glycosylase 1 [Roseovarius albus]|uniref:DNA-3-methyladenine glycosylase 1 n=1 Tax=Roseovarius albus TaxID=1247867 RepID=A0A1X6ZWE8_9RHOB|nr:DNA-3-methyladenine glycosylase I [Roseovarius albus]SLN63471.1 DNA-3-methyladenine glycosylase 1 [Roseovarius albus]
MRTFDDIYQIAIDRKGSAAAVEALLRTPLPLEELREIPEDRWLAMMAKCIFQAGFSWKVIESKWEGFEAAFDGFDIGRCAFMDDEKFDSLISDTRIIRNGTKIAAVRDNAAFLLELRAEGGVGETLGGWPSTDFIGLLEMLKKRGSRLGGSTGPIALRFVGRDGFLLSADVTARLIAEGVIDKPATSKSAMKAVQSAFNTWMDQSGRSLTEISKVLALSV